MKWLFQPLLMLIASSSESELAKQLEFLKAENQMLRRRLSSHIHLDDEEKRLIVRLGEAVGPAVRVLMSIVSYATYRRYVGQVGNPPPAVAYPHRRGGRPRKSDEVRELVLRLARENDWGYTRSPCDNRVSRLPSATDRGAQRAGAAAGLATSCPEA